MNLLILINIITIIVATIILVNRMHHLCEIAKDTYNQSWKSCEKSGISVDLMRSYLNPFSEYSYLNVDVKELDELLKPRFAKYVDNEEKLSKIYDVSKLDGKLVNEQSKLAREIGQLLLREKVITDYKNLKEVIS